MDSILDFIQTKLEIYFHQKFGPQGAVIGFLASGNWDPLTFSDNQTTILLVNIEEEKVMRPDNLYQATRGDGSTVRANPEIRLNLYMLFVAKNNDYKEAWKQLHAVIAFFQGHKLFNPTNSPDIPEGIQQLVFELNTPSFSEQNEIWSALKAPYHPSVLFKVRSIFIQEESASTSVEIDNVSLNLGNS